MRTARNTLMACRRCHPKKKANKATSLINRFRRLETFYSFFLDRSFVHFSISFLWVLVINIVSFGSARVSAYVVLRLGTFFRSSACGGKSGLRRNHITPESDPIKIKHYQVAVRNWHNIIDIQYDFTRGFLRNMKLIQSSDREIWCASDRISESIRK